MLPPCAFMAWSSSTGATSISYLPTISLPVNVLCKMSRYKVHTPRYTASSVSQQTKMAYRGLPQFI
jgi:hypothetical protein